MTLRHVGEGRYATPTGRWLVVLDSLHPEPAERGWTVLEVVSDEADPLGWTVPRGPIHGTRAEALAWVQAHGGN